MAGGEGSNESYRDCLRNHAASLGSYATDGCGEFTLNDSSPGELKCAACGCHRNFHRKIVIASNVSISRDSVYEEEEEMIEYGARHLNSMSSHEIERSTVNKKRNRTKFTVEQKEKMLEFAEKLGWKMIRKDEDKNGDEDQIGRFCRSLGISRQVFKVWMHNHKNISSPSTTTTSAYANNNASSLTQ